MPERDHFRPGCGRCTGALSAGHTLLIAGLIVWVPAGRLAALYLWPLSLPLIAVGARGSWRAARHRQVGGVMTVVAVSLVEAALCLVLSRSLGASLLIRAEADRAAGARAVLALILLLGVARTRATGGVVAERMAPTYAWQHRDAGAGGDEADPLQRPRWQRWSGG